MREMSRRRMIAAQRTRAAIPFLNENCHIVVEMKVYTCG